jgi:arylsulfatase A-like enzyme
VSPTASTWIRVGWGVAIATLGGVRIWNALAGPLLRGYDAHGHVAYVLYLDLYQALPWADQGWSYFHPPLHYLLGWLLAQAGDTELLLRGLALLGGAASLGLAGLAARVVKLATPERPAIPLLAFVSVAALPVLLYTSTMEGNELSAAFLGALGFTLWLGNELRPRPTLRRDALAGAVFGLALLTKFSAAIPLAAIAAALLLRGVGAGRDAAAWRRVSVRGVVLAGTALVLAGPWYARNILEFGTPFQLSRDNPHVASLERSQPPGERHASDFLRVSPLLFRDPNPQTDHQLHSVWGSAYGQTWADLRTSWDTLPAAVQPRIRAARVWMVRLGLAPSLLVLLGAGLALVDVARGRRRRVYLPLFILALASLAAFARFAVVVPHFSALKASYLLGLTLPFAVFLGRGFEASLSIGKRSAGALAALAVLVPAAAALVVACHALVLPALDSHKSLGLLYYYFGDRDTAHAFYRDNQNLAIGPRHVWTDNLASLALIAGRPSDARSLFQVHPPKPGKKPFRWNQRGVANALAGDLEAAVKDLSRAISAGAGEVGLANRGAVHAAAGALALAEADLRDALDADPQLAPAWHSLSRVLDASGRVEDAAEARSHAREAASHAPRGHPYGIPDGLGQYPSWQIDMRWMLWTENAGLKLARAPFRPEDAIAIETPYPTPPAHPHIALIVIDSLRADHLGAYGYPVDTSPQIDALASTGVIFTRAIAPSSWTLPSTASLFTGRHPTEHRASAWGRGLPRAFATLGERLSDAGYTTVGVSGNFVHINERNGFSRGFDAWTTLSFETDAEDEALFVHGKGEKPIAYRAPTATEVNRALLDAIPEVGDRSLFLYAHYMEPHSGYEPSEASLARLRGSAAVDADGAPATSAYITSLARGEREADAQERQRLIDLYDAEIADADAAVGELLRALDERGIGENLVVVIVSDHGEEFEDHGGWFHGLNLHRASVSIPLVIHDARREGAGEVRDEAVDLLDVTASVLDLAGVEPGSGMHGRALLSTERATPRPLLGALDPDRIFEAAVGPRQHRRAVVYGTWKIVIDADGQHRVFDLERDPNEQTPLPLARAKVPEPVRRLARRLARHLDAENERARPLDRDARERLRALGYAK